MAIEVPSSLAQSNGNGLHHRHDDDDDDHASKSNSSTTIPPENIVLASNTAATSSYPRIRINSHLLPIIGLFVFYIGHDALQERMFRFDGFEFGFFMTLVEVLVMLIGSILSEGDSNVGGLLLCTLLNTTKKRKQRRRHKTLSLPVLIRIAWVGLFLALAHGLGNTSLNYSPYPLKVAFKSCKLVPTMALGACVTGRKHTALQYTAAFVMGMGLATLTAADVFSSKEQKPLGHDTEWKKELGPFVGPILLTISTVFDSIVPNLQEQLLQKSKVKTSEMILVSNMVMCVVLVLYTIYSGELILAWNYCIQNREASGVLLAQGLCAYFGLKSYLSIIRDYGGVIGVLLANGRKIVTIILSFLLFAKPFNERHFVGLILVFVGVYLGYISKKGGKKEKDAPGSSNGNGTSSSTPGRKRRKERRKKIENDETHEHNV